MQFMHKNIDSRYKGFSDIKDSFWGTEAFISRFHCNEIIVTYQESSVLKLIQCFINGKSRLCAFEYLLDGVLP